MTVKNRVAAYRARMRAAGLRPVQIWVPDARSPEFAAAAHRASFAAAEADRHDDTQAFIDAMNAELGDSLPD